MVPTTPGRKAWCTPRPWASRSAWTGGRRVIYRLNHLFEFRNGLIQRELGVPDVASIFAQMSQPEEQEEQSVE